MEIKIIEKKIKNFNLRVANGEVKLSVPLGTEKAVVDDFLNRHRQWIKEKLFAQKRIVDENSFYLLGQKKAINYLVENDQCYFKNDVLSISKNNFEKLFENFKIEYGSAIYLKLLDEYLKLFKEQQVQLMIKKYKSKWGSCQTRERIIRLNSNLIFENINFIRYIIAHEIAHLKVGGHSKKYYDWLVKHVPNHIQLKNSRRS